MNRLIHLFAKGLPFAGFSLVISAGIASGFSPPLALPYFVPAILMGLAGQALVWYLGDRDLFGLGLIFVLCFGALSHLISPGLGVLFLSKATAALYFGLFLAALLPPLVGIKPFTVDFAKKSYPEAIQKTVVFALVNRKINWIWAVIFLASFLIALPVYHEDTAVTLLLQNLFAALPSLLVGIPVNLKLPGLLTAKENKRQGSLHFDGLKEAFTAMPFGLNRERAGDQELSYQFYFTGAEIFSGFLVISKGRCTFELGEHSGPAVTVTSDAKLWLDITNGETSGDEAYLAGRYQAEGDISLLLQLASLFTMDEQTPAKAETPDDLGAFQYANLGQGVVKKVLMIDGGPRNSKYSKSLLMARSFAKGAEEAGAKVQWLTLRKLNIANCTGCYQCWTKTPGECRIDRDPMEQLREQYREADLIGWVTPLYTFSLHPLLKSFMDRLLPEMFPYMSYSNELTSHQSRTTHPKAMVVFSAAGFPELKGNFEGLAWTFRNLSLHGEAGTLAGEFYLPAAELLAHPAYQQRKSRVEQSCADAGKEVVLEGRIDKKHMTSVSRLDISVDTFHSQANFFWERLDNKKSYYQGQPTLPPMAVEGGDITLS